MCFWPPDEPRIHAMIARVEQVEDHIELGLAINNRSEVHGEIVMRIPTAEARCYRIGSVYAAHFVKADGKHKALGCFWPDEEPRIKSVITAISNPFDSGRMVEMQWKITNRPEVHGEITLRIPAADAHQYHKGMEYTAYFRLVSKMRDA